MKQDDFAEIRLDARAVRTLAHPLRSRLLTDLRRNGPSTATELAVRLRTNTGATSYHLRALQDVGLVTDTGEGIGRRRPWRATTDVHSWIPSDFAHDEDAAAALGWLERDYVRQFAERADHWLDVRDAWPQEWVDALGLSDRIVEVSRAEAAQLIIEVADVVARYRRSNEPDARRLHFTVLTSPVDLNPSGSSGD